MPLLALSNTEWAAVLLFGGAALVLAVPAVRAYLARRRSGTNVPAPVSDRALRFNRLAREREELESLMSDVRELTRLCAAQIDARTARLEHLLERAERAAAQLNTRASDAPLIGTRRVSVDAPAPADPVTSKVYSLADAGRSPVEIASELGEHVGKVELMLALRS